MRVLERAPQLLQVGYIVMLTPNGLSCLHAMGQDVLQHFEDHAFMLKVRPRGLFVLRWHSCWAS